MGLCPHEPDAGTSGPAQAAPGLAGQWQIENGLYQVRDVMLGEDASQIRCGQCPAVFAAVRNTALGLVRLAQQPNVAAAQRRYAMYPWEVLALLGITPPCSRWNGRLPGSPAPASWVRITSGRSSVSETPSEMAMMWLLVARLDEERDVGSPTRSACPTSILAASADAGRGVESFLLCYLNGLAPGCGQDRATPASPSMMTI